MKCTKYNVDSCVAVENRSREKKVKQKHHVQRINYSSYQNYQRNTKPMIRETWCSQSNIDRSHRWNWRAFIFPNNKKTTHKHTYFTHNNNNNKNNLWQNTITNLTKRWKRHSVWPHSLEHEKQCDYNVLRIASNIDIEEEVVVAIQIIYNN